MSEALQRLVDALEALTNDRYTADESEGKRLDLVLGALLEIRAEHQAEPDEESQWECRGPRGDWEIIMRPIPRLQ